MAFAKRHYDYKVNGVNIYTLTAKRDFALNQQERINLVKEIMYDENGHLCEFLETFLDDPSIFCLSSKKPLSHEINVCNEIEKLANYILYSPDGERLTRKVEYNFYTDRDAFKKAQREASLYYDEDVDPDDALDFLIDSSHNYLCETSQKIYASDLKRFEILRSYSEAISNYQKKMEEVPKEHEFINYRRKIGNIISSLRKEQCEAKSALAKTIIFKHIAKSGEKLTEPEVDGFNFDAVKSMFESCNPKHVTVFGELGDVFQDILNKIEKTEQEKQILASVTDEKKPNYAEIARINGIGSSSVYNSLNKIRNKIIREYMRMYEDLWYLVEDYGWYRKCSVCGEIKLLSDNYFPKDPSSNDGFRSVCKKCT